MPISPAEPPLYLREGGPVAGTLQAVEPMEDGIVATIEGIRVSLPGELEGKLRDMVGREIVVACMDKRWRVGIQRAARR